MILDTTKETVCVNQIIGQKLESIMVEGDMIVPDIKPDILNTISSSGNICIYKKEVMDGKIRIDGTINVYIMYLADNENSNVRALNTNLDFTKVIDMDNCNQDMNIDDDMSIKAIECKVINGRKINIKAIIDANIKVYSNSNIQIINEINNMNELQTLENMLEINSLVGNGENRVYAKDTIIIDNIDDLAEILRVNINVVNKETKVSYNKVLAKADAEVKIMYLTEDDRINTVTNRIPVMGFIDMPNVTDDNICNTKYKLKNLLVKPNNVEEHSIYIEAELELSCFVYEKKNIKIIQDLYSPVENLNFNKKTITTRCYKDKASDLCVLKEKIPAENIEDNKILDMQVGVNILSQNIGNGRINYEAEAQIQYTYLTGNSNKIDVKSVNIAFNFSMENQSITMDSMVETNIEVADTTCVVLPDFNIETKINLEFNIEIYKNEVLNIIDEINQEEDGEVETYSMVIYYVKPKDTLWKIAKQFKSTVSDIVRVNGIENPDKLNVGMQLFIPKYSNVMLKNA